MEPTSRSTDLSPNKTRPLLHVGVNLDGAPIDKITMHTESAINVGQVLTQEIADLPRKTHIFRIHPISERGVFNITAWVEASAARTHNMRVLSRVMSPPGSPCLGLVPVATVRQEYTITPVKMSESHLSINLTEELERLKGAASDRFTAEEPQRKSPTSSPARWRVEDLEEEGEEKSPPPLERKQACNRLDLEDLTSSNDGGVAVRTLSARTSTSCCSSRKGVRSSNSTHCTML
jgi:hypothetical protein